MPLLIDARRALAILALSLAAVACGDAAPTAPEAPSLARGGPKALPTNTGRIYFSSDFTGNRELYSINPDGSDRRRLTYTDGREFEVAVSRDGKKLVFVVAEEGDAADLYTMNVDGSNRRRLTTLAHWSVRAPSWSPDGKTILFSYAPPGEQPGVWSLPTSGSGPKRLTSPDLHAGYGVLSPDGTRLAYVEYRLDPQQPLGYASYLHVMNADGTADTLLRDCQYGLCVWPAWSPDGTRIVYSEGNKLRNCLMNQPSPFCNVASGDLDGGERAVFSPDGSRVAIQDVPVVGEGQWISVADVNGSGLTKITGNVFDVAGIAWGR